MIADDSRQPVFDDIPPRPSEDVANEEDSHGSAGVSLSGPNCDVNTRELAGCLRWCEVTRARFPRETLFCTMQGCEEA
jgi:hypothetical protein